MLDKAGDIKVSAVGDISLTESVRQAVLIRVTPEGRTYTVEDLP